MKKLFITIAVLLTILALSLLIASCGPQEITKVVTGAAGPTTYIIESEPPEIPHTFLFDVSWITYQGPEPICFICHPVPPQHTGFWMDETLCDGCHEVSDNPVLLPGVTDFQ